MNNRKLIPLLVYLAVLILVFSWVTGMTSTVNSDLAYSELVGLFEKEQVQEFTVKGNTIVLTLNTPYNGKSQIRAPGYGSRRGADRLFRLHTHDF